MKTRKSSILLLLVLALIGPKTFSQDITTEGTDFWVSFIGNGFDDNNNGGSPYLKIQVLISSLYDCTGVICNPNSEWSESFTIEANGLKFIDIPREQAYMECNENPSPKNRGLHIITDQPVSVYCANTARYSFDASYVLPTPALADDYIIQTYDQSIEMGEHTSSFIVIAVEEGATIVDITPTVRTLDGKPAGQTFSITLQQGQVYQVRSNRTSLSSSRDLSGSRVTAHDCKKIAVFNGNTLTMVPADGGNDSDCIFEQAMPVQAWGKQFVVTASLGRVNKDYVKIISATNNNEIKVNGQPYATLNANEFISFRMPETSYFIEATSRCAVYLYNPSQDNQYGQGAPSMVWIAPIEQRINELTFNTFNDLDPGHVSVNLHYINIIVKSEDANNVFLDGNPIPENQFDAVAGNNSYRFYRQEISHGAHHLSCEGGFNAHVYGFGHATGYAYMVGSKAADLTTSITVNEEVVNTYDTVTNCVSRDITFEADINFIDYNLMWDFGDGTTSSDNPATHQYEDNGLFEATLTVTTPEPPCGGTSATNTSYFYINLDSDPDQEIYDTVCFTAPSNYTEQGFNLHYETPGSYYQTITLTNESGCESHATLNLTVSQLINMATETVNEKCDFFEWRGYTLTTSGHYTDTVPGMATECDKVYHLELDLDYSPKPKISCNTQNATVFGDTVAVITNTEFFSFQYDFYVEDTLNHIDDWEYWEWHISQPSWLIEPFEKEDGKHYCRVYVAERCDEYVELSCTVYNHCDQDSTTNSFYLKSSFYGIDENETILSDFNIAPNPNNGTMELNFENLIGKTDLKVFDMHGALIDQFQVNSESSFYSIPYQCKSLAEGLYFFVATWRNTVLTKKVIILQ
jgi:hypothetical protein